MSVFLCGNTGFINRGCEAIVDATVSVIPFTSGDIFLLSATPDYDSPIAKRLGVNILPYENRIPRVRRLFYKGLRMLNRKSLMANLYIQKNTLKQLRKNDICLDIGGDVYCYSRPKNCLALNGYTYMKNITNILWCCSVEEKKITKEIAEALKRYTYILVREQLSYRTLLSIGVPREKLLKCCDPAFFLSSSPVSLPVGFSVNNTVGINLSEIVIKEPEGACMQNVRSLIDYILQKTDMNICLIPHVYKAKEDRNDLFILKKLYDTYKNDRICIVDQEYNCEQLKYIISCCRFMIAARTHASIAAYSTCVPTIVLGYSVKSQGIAMDLFGKTDGLVLPYDSLDGRDQLKTAFIQMIENETNIKEHLKTILPAYKKTLKDAISTAFGSEKMSNYASEICREDLCTGCMACMAKCPQGAVSAYADKEGFIRPLIDKKSCVQCGLCRKICPVLNRYHDDGKIPDTFAVQNKSDTVRMSSSSGGVFALLAEDTLSKGGIVVGAAFTEHHKVKHIVCSDRASLSASKTSKYVQSDCSDAYNQITDALDKKQQVLFVGTPCQVAGVKAYLGNGSPLLVCADLICHGVPSPLIFEKYLSYIEKTEGSALNEVYFRDKTYGWRNHSIRFQFNNGEKSVCNVKTDPYLRGFVSGMYMRPSCYQCPFKQTHRQSDITLGDFWGVEDRLPDFDDDMGTSLVLIHTDKGRDAIRSVQESVRSVAVNFFNALEKNGSYESSVKKNLSRDEFFSYLLHHSIGKAFRKYVCGNKLVSYCRIIKRQF